MHAIPKPEFPRPEKRRENWLNLNGQWDFRLFPAGAEEAEKSFAANRSAYDREIAVPFSWVCPLSGVEEDVAGIGWYRRAVSEEKPPVPVLWRRRLQGGRLCQRDACWIPPGRLLLF